MGHGLFGTVGLPLSNQADVSTFIDKHNDHIEWHAALHDEWVDGQWVDPSGVMLAASRHTDGTVLAVPGFLGTPRTSAARFSGVEDDNAVVAEIVDVDGRPAERFCADSAQFRDLHILDADTPTPVVITGLVRHVNVYADAEAFNASPDGETIHEKHVALPGYYPIGMMLGGSINPTTMINAVVDESRTVTVEAIGERVVVATVEPVRGFGMSLCWPTDLAPQPEVGNVIHVIAHLTVFIPEIWRQIVERPTHSQ
ncbi:hypothetical protein GOARA_006_00060 [Gordonia araii NBRC 100433]|uniref:Uncharacterized protein n=1 Tax=Gordonia araii NBRC 100433 TaxID=1073574 RepID=G7GXC2_9ACTN|nr:hypothetical protein [Gordonia araii]NNG95965.1 hypothetical protein [Gordonia araii NBRC 100433]GAB08247.1 hypothetical protein GOARA_006_00060 [Gordonia araii NBRC 100433]